RSAPSPEVAAAAESIGGPNPIVGSRRKDLIDSVRTVLGEAARHPGNAANSLGNMARTALDIARGRADIAANPKDRRFADPAWSGNGLYHRLVQLYLAANGELD